MTPPLVQNPGMEVHIHPFQAYHVRNKNLATNYLQTSPEFHMKKLLSMKEEQLNNIFQICYCFRDEPISEIHRSQFLMLEWYRKNERYEKIMQDCENLIKFLQNSLSELPIKEKLPAAQAITVQEIMQEFCQIDILQFLETRSLKEVIKKNFKDVPIPKAELSWDDLFFLLFLNKVEPHLKKIPFLFLYEYPAPLSALSTIKKDNPFVCERFEMYIRGIEIGNCFNELTSYSEQKKRFDEQMKEKQMLYGYQLNEPSEFYDTLQRGYPASAGIAVGVERLFLSLVKTENPFYS